MAHDNGQMPQADLLEQLAIRERQLEQLQQAYVQLQGNGNNPAQQERLFKNINRLATFTGTGEISINSFFSSVEYLLQTVEDPQLKREATRTIFYRTIQGQAKDAVINIPEPDNWDLIKATLKLRYRPDTEPHQIYKRICDLRVNSVSELAVEIQNIKYKNDELIVYHMNDNFIDLSNVESLLVNTAKEMTQGTLLDKIYEVRDLSTILKIMMQRRYENSCIRYQYRKGRPNQNNYRNNNQNTNQQYNQQNNTMQNAHQNKNTNQQYNQQNNTMQNVHQNYQSNNSGQVRQNNTPQNFRGNNSGQSRRYQNNQWNQQAGSHQSRQNRPANVVPMEVDNIEANQHQNNTDQSRYENDNYNSDHNSNSKHDNNQMENYPQAEFNNTVFFTKPPRMGYH